MEGFFFDVRHLFVDNQFPRWVRACRNRDMEMLTASITASNINTLSFDLQSVLAHAVRLNWVDGVTYLLSRGASMWYAIDTRYSRSVVWNAQNMSMMRLLKVHVNSPLYLFDGGVVPQQTKLRQLLVIFDELDRAFVTELIDAGATLPLDLHQLPQWITERANSRDSCRHITLLLMHRPAGRGADIMRLIAREVWATRTDTNAWCEPPLRRSARLKKMRK